MLFPSVMKMSLHHVLAVEDNPELVGPMWRLLQHLEAELTIASSGERAMEIVRQKCFDLIILNIRLPGINGLEVCRRLKADPSLKGIPVIFSSGETSRQIVDEAYRLGAVDYLFKPCPIADFQRHILAQLPPVSSGTPIKA